MRTLLKQTGRAAAEDSKSVRVIPFEVGPGLQALKLRFDFGPRTTIDEVRNTALLEAAYALWNQFWASGRPVIAVAARDWHGPGQGGPFPGAMAFTGVLAECR